MSKTVVIHLCKQCLEVIRGGLEMEEITIATMERECELCGRETKDLHTVYKSGIKRLIDFWEKDFTAFQEECGDGIRRKCTCGSPDDDPACTCGLSGGGHCLKHCKLA